LPTSYLLDTNSVTALAQNHPMARTHLTDVDAGDTIATCFIVMGEWEYGILNVAGAKRQEQIRAIGAPILAALTAIWESTPAIALRYGAIHAQLRAAGQMIPTNDIWIAATALLHGATVVTTDPHFRRVAGLSVVDWTQP
jgi:tRNA(fMet)-specific endonuclease VapC